MCSGKNFNKYIMMLFCCFGLITTPNLFAFAAEKPLETITTLNAKIEYNKVYAENLSNIDLKLEDEEKLKLRETAPEVSMDSTIKLTPEEIELKNALQIQKGKDIEDIKMLWEATVEKNPIIKFALDKVASPPQQRPVKASIMARTIATMMQGAAIVPSLFGMGMASEYGSLFGGQVLSQAFAKKFMAPPGMPTITEPELIQLIALIESLQGEIIKNYYNYKASLESLMLEKKNTILQERNYQRALESKDVTAIVIASALYDKAKLSELRVKQQVKLQRIQLERLAGIDAVSNLNLTLPEGVIKAKENQDKSDTSDINSTTNSQPKEEPSNADK